MIMEASNIANGNVRFNEGRRKLRFRAAEATKLIEQQMYLFGRDVLHPRGNLLRGYGCTAGKLPGQKHHIRVYLHAAPGMLVTLQKYLISEYRGFFVSSHAIALDGWK